MVIRDEFKSKPLIASGLFKRKTMTEETKKPDSSELRRQQVLQNTEQAALVKDQAISERPGDEESRASIIIPDVNNYLNTTSGGYTSSDYSDSDDSD
jgi:hypothetical protein